MAERSQLEALPKTEDTSLLPKTSLLFIVAVIRYQICNTQPPASEFAPWPPASLKEANLSHGKLVGEASHCLSCDFRLAPSLPFVVYQVSPGSDEFRNSHSWKQVHIPLRS